MRREDIPIPHEAKLPKTNPYYEEIIRRHEEACMNDVAFYHDPKSGYTVFTAIYLMQKGSCCGSLCRHCRYGEF